MNRRDFLRLSAAGALAGLAPRSLMSAEGKPPPNVLFIFVDDLRPQLGCYGAKTVKSPNIDRLAREGMLFENAYCQQAVCAPSRASVLSGWRPDSTGIYDLEHPLRSMHPDVITLPQFFKQAGYETITIGKVYHHHDDDKANWTRMPTAQGVGYALEANKAIIAGRRKEGLAKGLKGTPLSRYARGPASECADVSDETYVDGANARLAIRQLGELKQAGKPFFMALGFLKPHLPFNSPKKYWDLYRREQFAVPPRSTPKDMPALALNDFGELRAYTDIPRQRGPLDDDKTRELIHGYHAAASFTDANIGKVLDELDRLKLADNTVVVLWGDHGWKLGDYGSWCKHTNFEIDTHVPLLFRGPGVSVGKRCKALVEMVDVFPSLAELTGGKAPAHCEGTSLKPLLADAKAQWKNFAVSQYPRGPVMGYSARCDKWRYTEWVGRDGQVVARELYDHSAGPIAAENLAERPEHAELVAGLSKRLKPYQRRKAQPAGGAAKKEGKRKNKE